VALRDTDQRPHVLETSQMNVNAIGFVLGSS